VIGHRGSLLPRRFDYTPGSDEHLFQLLFKVFIVAFVIFKRLNPGAATDGAKDVLVVRRHLLASEPAQLLPLGDT